MGFCLLSSSHGRGSSVNVCWSRHSRVSKLKIGWCVEWGECCCCCAPGGTIFDWENQTKMPVTFSCKSRYQRRFALVQVASRSADWPGTRWGLQWLTVKIAWFFFFLCQFLMGVLATSGGMVCASINTIFFQWFWNLSIPQCIISAGFMHHLEALHGRMCVFQLHVVMICVVTVVLSAVWIVVIFFINVVASSGRGWLGAQRVVYSIFAVAERL